jgi:hypothetical protein
MANKPGRPPVDKDDPSVSVHVKVPAKTYDMLYADARAARVSVPELLRRRALLRRPSPRDDQSER